VRIEQAFTPAPSPESLRKAGASRRNSALAPFAPRLVRTAASQKIVRLGTDVDLTQLPGPSTLPPESHRAVTAAVLVSRDPNTGDSVIGHATLTIRSPNELAVRWEPLDRLAQVFESYRERRERMPLAAAVGGHPARLLAAMANPPFPVDRDCLAGILASGPLESVRGRTLDVEVPAEADFVLEGTIDTAAAMVESGPIVTPTCGLAASRSVPVLSVDALTRRANPVMPVIPPGDGGGEWAMITRTMHRLLLPLTRLVVDELVDCNLPECGRGRTMAWVSVRKSDAESARRTARALWELPGTRFCQFMVLVDEDVDVDNGQEIWAAKGRNARCRQDVFMEEGPPDPWAGDEEAGLPCRRLAFDATTKTDRPVIVPEECE
jgi:4-hydroxy-3-polyprenylbenzoate decarboxylase